MRTQRLKRARIPYTWGEITEMLILAGAFGAFVYRVWSLP